MKVFQPLTAALGALATLQQAAGSPIPSAGQAKQPNGLGMETKASTGGPAPRNGAVLPRGAHVESRAAGNSTEPSVSVHQQHAEGLGLFSGTALMAVGALQVSEKAWVNGVTAGVGAGSLLISGVFHHLDSGKPRTDQPADHADCANVPKQEGLGFALVAGTALSGIGAYAMNSERPVVRTLGTVAHVAGDIALGAAATLHAEEVKKPRC